MATVNLEGNPIHGRGALPVAGSTIPASARQAPR